MGFESSDDAAVYRIDDNKVLIQTVDLFPPMVDDPYHFGQIAAANALSDIYAMGGAPALAMNILCYPEDMDSEIVEAIMRGGYEKVMEAGAIIAGGHSIKDHEPKYGLCVTGFAKPGEILKNSSAKPGDILILTKPLGTGILNTAAKAGLTGKETERIVVESMARLNRKACEVMKKYPVNSCTDVTGFGLLGHAYEMGAGSGVTIRLDAAAMPLLPDARDMARMGIIPAGAYANRVFLEGKIHIAGFVPLEIADIMFDPQTSGGLLIAVPGEHSQALFSELKKEDPASAIIGRVTDAENLVIFVE
ncbi:selenide, water dikinase [Bacillota bacterium]